MAAQKISRKRKTYEPTDYARLLRGLIQLMKVVNKLQPDRNTWDIEGEWNGTGVIYFVDSRDQSLFAEYEHFDCRTIKLVNFGKPATRLTFFKKHKYILLKNSDLTREDKEQRITNYINELTVKRAIKLDKINKLTGAALSDERGMIGMMEQEIKTWQDVLRNLEHYDFAVSNYRRDYQYVTLNYKYRTSEQEYANAQEHLLNPQRDGQGVITQQRYNLIFVDTREISREHPHQHKEIENFLNNFSLITQTGKQQLYARPKPPESLDEELNSVASSQKIDVTQPKQDFPKSLFD
ncbi:MULTISPECIES: hypothetical protein [Rudanella]|uniref:hypothetical protein n=1 Tax=Rudanella TaxID=451373 RepID=UPI0003671901|nr:MULTISPECIES: hypothetical protein [Rudanella]